MREIFSPGPVENHREREKGAIVYPVFSRRSKGLSLGINLFPGKKTCDFDCAYCEVFPFKTDIEFSIETMEEALAERINQARAGKITIRDICFSGNGEPTASPHFSAALESAAKIREKNAPEAALVVITNGTGLLDSSIFDVLMRGANDAALDIWLKIDAATESWYRNINRAALPHGTLIAWIKEFSARAPFTVQCMLCAVNSAAPPAEETAAWERLVLELAAGGRDTGNAGPKAVQLYGKARPAPDDPLASPLPESYLYRRAESLRRALGSAGFGGEQIPVEVFP